MYLTIIEGSLAPMDPSKHTPAGKYCSCLILIHMNIMSEVSLLSKAGIKNLGRDALTTETHLIADGEMRVGKVFTRKTPTCIMFVE